MENIWYSGSSHRRQFRHNPPFSVTAIASNPLFPSPTRKHRLSQPLTGVLHRYLRQARPISPMVREAQASSRILPAWRSKHISDTKAHENLHMSK